MRRTFCYALFALLLSNGAVFAQRHIPPRQHVRVIALHRYHFRPYCFFPSIAPVPFLYPVPYSTTYAVPNFVAPSIEYVFLGSSSPARLPLTFKDGTTYFVSDYWRQGDQLHFTTVEEGGTKSVPHSVSFDNLDLQRTKDTATAQGFKFLIRDQPIEQWLEQHSQHSALRTGTTGKR